MSSRWWYGVVVGSVYVLLYQLPAGTVVGRPLAGYLQGGAVVAGLLAGVSIHHDFVSIREEATWDITLPLWVIGAVFSLGTIVAGPAYCLRRYSAVRGRAPSGRWRYGVYAGLIAWVGFLGAVAVTNTGASLVDVSLFESSLAFSVLAYVWAWLPVVLYLDLEHVCAYTDLSPNRRVLVGLALVPVVNLVACGLYLTGRYDKTGDAVSESPSFSAAERASPEQLSPWYLRAIDVQMLYVVAVSVAEALSLGVAGYGWRSLAVVLWPLCGLAYGVCVYYDTAALESAGVEWTRSELYYLGVLVPPIAFMYLLLRHERVREWRRDARGAGHAAT